MLYEVITIPTMKGRDRTIFRYDTRGPAAGFSVEADSTGFVRGYLFQDPIPLDSPPADWDLAPYFGDGTLSLIRFPEGAREPVVITSYSIHYTKLSETRLVERRRGCVADDGLDFDAVLFEREGVGHGSPWSGWVEK